jgi:hypothetical protein
MNKSFKFQLVTMMSGIIFTSQFSYKSEVNLKLKSRRIDLT